MVVIASVCDILLAPVTSWWSLLVSVTSWYGGTIFHAVVVARVTYASPAWSGFITTTDRQRADAFLCRSKRSGFCQPDLPEFDQLLEERDDEVFDKIKYNPNHTNPN